MQPKIVVRKQGDLSLIVPEPFYEVLKQVPALLGSALEHPRMRSRLLPEPYDDGEANAEWRKHVTPDLAHLFESGREIVNSDLLRASRALSIGRAWQVEIPAAHHTAWMSSLNAARLALGELHKVTQEDMETLESRDPGSEREYAILRIHLLGWIEELLVTAARRDL